MPMAGQNHLSHHASSDAGRPSCSEPLSSENYQLHWPGKHKALHEVSAPASAHFVPCREESVEYDTTGNLFIEGDNLEALKLLHQSHVGKIQVIFIDPPYNTGRNFTFNDAFQQSATAYSERQPENDETTGRFHSDWLSMIYPRLKLAWGLLADDGIIAVAIDDREVFQLGLVMDEIFGPSNRLACAPWLSEPSGGKEKTGLRKGHEYILIYFKRTAENISRQERSAGALNLRDRTGRYRKGRELMKWGGTSLRSDRPNQFYPLPAPHGEPVLPYRSDGMEGHWRWGRENPAILAAMSNPEVFHWELRPFDSGICIGGKTERWVPYEKIRSEKKSIGWSTWLDRHGTNADATRELKALFGSKPFDTPKPTALIKWLIALHADDSALVLDFFAGSASTAHAVIDLNSEDGGTRQFIMVQCNEPCSPKSAAFKEGYASISEIGKERLRRVYHKIKRPAKGENPPPDSGFRVWKICPIHQST